MKSNKVQDDDSFLTNDENLYHTQDTEYLDDRKKRLFSFGSSVLAVIYMANTMVIPNMNQLYSELDFQSPKTITISVIFYWTLMIMILAPCYLVIKICRDKSNPIFAYIVKDDSLFLYKAFIYANLTINVVGLFNIVVRMCDNLIKTIPYIYTSYHDALTNKSDNFYSVVPIYTVFVLAMFYGIYRISYFEHFNEIQFRLLATFIGKWIISLTIFLLMKNSDSSQCKIGYLQRDDKYLNILISLFDAKEYNFHSITHYFFNICCCISYPFFEVFYVKRETLSGYNKVSKCYWYQMGLRSLFFFYQVFTWDLVYDNLDCFYQPLFQVLNCCLIVFVAISLGPIYAHNYTLNKEILNDHIYTATEEENKKQIKEIYLLAISIFIGLIMILLICKLVLERFDQVKGKIFDLTYSIHTICFGFVCIALPIYIWIKGRNSNSKIVDWLAIGQIGMFVLAFAVISICPLLY